MSTRLGALSPGLDLEARARDADALYDEYLEQYDEDDQVERRSP